MAMDPGALLVGPRGRRLCLELSLAPSDAGGPLGDELRLAAMYAAYGLDPGRGTSRVMFGLGGAEPARHPDVAPADVADLLLSVPLAAPDDRSMLAALQAAVDNARYWQEPDGEDVLAASAPMRDAPARVAAHVAGRTWTRGDDDVWAR